MKLFIPKEALFDNPIPPRVFLCTTGKKRIQELPAINRQLNGKWSQYSEFSFEMQRTYIDIITGETKVHPAYDKVEAPRNIFLEGYGYWAIQNIDDTSGDMDIKNVSSFSLEYATSNKYLTNFHINTGEIDSKEVLYNESIHGIDYNTDADSFYKLASGAFDPYESYYKKTITEDSYIWEQVQIADANEYAEHINKPSPSEYDKLYVKNFPNVQFYNRNRPELSLLHIIFENIPEWQIGNVDQSLWRKERKFSEARVSIYDFLMNNIVETFGCTIVWDSLTGLVHFYESVEDDEEENEASTRWETDVFISKDNLASECKVSYSSDNIKTKLVVTGSDNLDIREVNLGRNEIMNLSFYHTLDWMEPDLFGAYSTYLSALKEAETGLDASGRASTKYPMSYFDAMKNWVSAQNRVNDLTNAVPAEGNVVLVGDEFKKLYCTYSPNNTAYYDGTITTGTASVSPDKLYLDEGLTKPIPTPSNKDMYVVQGVLLVYNKDTKLFKVDSDFTTRKTALIDKLNQYHVDEDTEANKQDNILLKLKNSASDIATIRIYDKRKVASSYEDKVKYYVKNTDGTWRKEPEPIKNGVEFNQAKATYGDNLYTNDYWIQSIVVKASSGVSEAPQSYSIMDWIKSTLTAERMALEGYKITYIGTMGAYFVLAKDETIPDNLQDYGVRLLEEKHKTYTTIFQTQTEAMYSQDKSQCIVQDDEPEGIYTDGTRWLDTNSNPVVLKEYRGNAWNIISASVSTTDQSNYENYQRYIDNYNKLVAVQQVLSEKEREATYCSNGYEVIDFPLDLRKTASPETDMYRAALQYFNMSMGTYNTLVELKSAVPVGSSRDIYTVGSDTYIWNSSQKQWVKGSHTVTKVSMNSLVPLYTFKTSADTTHIFSIYLSGSRPYVAYNNSQGVYKAIMDYIRGDTEMSKFFTLDQWIRLSPLIKEDEFNDSNFLLTGYESEEERIKICQELMDAAAKELNTLCKPSLEFSMTMANILALPEFEPLFNQFQLGNFIRVQIRDGYVKRSRLLEVNINFDDLSNFSCTFGNLVTTKSEVDRHADLLSRAVTAGKQVATSAGSWQRAVDKSNALESEMASGFQNATIEVGKANGQNVIWDSTGIWGRKLRDGSTDQYEDEQFRIVNNKLLFSNDGFKTSKAVVGKYRVGDQEKWGVLAEDITADTIVGKFISGGSLDIGGSGGHFKVGEDGSVTILGPDDKDVYANHDEVEEIAQARRYRIELKYDGSTIFNNTGQSCVITCRVFDWDNDITDKLPSGTTFKWTRSSNVDDTAWNAAHTYTDINTITITNSDIEKSAQFFCECTFDEEKIQ